MFECLCDPMCLVLGTIVTDKFWDVYCSNLSHQGCNFYEQRGPAYKESSV